jgi:DNA-binding protein Fis
MTSLLICNNHRPQTFRQQRRTIHHLALAEMEKSHILQILEKAGNNKSQAAQWLGIHRDTLLRKLKKYGLHTDDD